MHHRSPLILASLLALLGLACGNRALDDDAGEEASTAATTDATTGTPEPTTISGPTTWSPSDTEDTSASGTTMAPPDDDDGMTTETPPLFDLGVIPDMPDNPPPPEMFDCDTVVDTPVSYQMIVGAKAYHGLVITPDGMLIGSDGNSLIESDYSGSWGLFLPGIGSGQQMHFLPDGDFAYATSDSAITRVRLDATIQTIRPGVGAYAVVVGPDGMIYSNSGAWIVRIDPVTGDLENVLTGFGSTPHSIGFSPSGHRIYVGVIGAPTVYYATLDASFDPTSPAMVLSSSVGGGNAWHDAVVVDACGYLYVPNFWDRTVYRIAPDGTTLAYWSPTNQNEYPHGFMWGTGTHGWKVDALYSPQPYNGNTVGELVIGVPPRDFEGAVLNPPSE